MNIRRIYLIIPILLLQFSCNQNNGKGKHIFTTRICSDIYVEGYRTYEGGALGSNITAEYLTDSINFRVYVGDFDLSESKYAFECKNKDTLIIYKLNLLERDSIKARKSNFYRIEDLKKLSNYGHAQVKNIAD